MYVFVYFCLCVVCVCVGACGCVIDVEMTVCMMAAAGDTSTVVVVVVVGNKGVRTNLVEHERLRNFAPVRLGSSHTEVHKQKHKDGTEDKPVHVVEVEHHKQVRPHPQQRSPLAPVLEHRAEIRRTRHGEGQAREIDEGV